MPTYRKMAVTANVTTVDCHKQVRSWRLLRTVMELLIPTCNCTFIQQDYSDDKIKNNGINFKTVSQQSSSSSSSLSSSIITGTIFGYRKGKVRFCIQTTSPANPILLLELAVPTTILAREMRGGVLRIALECSVSPKEGCSLLEMPVWKMYCNGRRVGYALRKKPSKADMEVLRKMKNMVVGAGVIEGKEIGCDQLEDDIMYLRGSFERVCGSPDAQSFHLIDPDGNINQDLSIFFLRSRS